MIGRLRGLILEKQPPLVLIESQGVGYEVNMPMTCFYELPDVAQEVMIHTHLVVREDAWLLFGFNHHQERRLFRELIKVNGVGPKLALAILSGMSAQQFILALEKGSIDTLIKLPGVGRKTAERLVVEMKDRLGKVQGDPSSMMMTPAFETESVISQQDAEAEAVSALITLGYKPQEASRMINRIVDPGNRDADNKAEFLIREALRAAL